MKIIISHSTTKRMIEGPFAICGSRKDLETIIARLQDALAQEFVYGWVDIYETSTKQPNTAPEPWDMPTQEKKEEPYAMECPVCHKLAVPPVCVSCGKIIGKITFP
jgi:hypothetical protein